jgi:hypothetical protein
MPPNVPKEAAFWDDGHSLTYNAFHGKNSLSV